MKSLFSKFISALLFAGLVSSLAGIQPVYAAGITVTSNADTIANNGLCTLREAIIRVNRLCGGVQVQIPSALRGTTPLHSQEANFL